MIELIFVLLHSEQFFTLVVAATIYFLLIYFLFSNLSFVLASLIKRPISNKPIPKHQIKTEITQSIRSAIIFGAGIIVPWLIVKNGYAHINTKVHIFTLVLECIGLIIWNDLHFYAVHRLLHAKFKKTHGVHHQSNTSTPFAAYSMSVTEAVLLGSVMPLAMLFYDFSIQSLIFLTIWSILINTLSHSNCDFFPKAQADSLWGFIKHHQQHHSYYNGNYSFFFSQLDRWFGTQQTCNHQEIK
ncbi:MAG: sterol desaturase family protein [Methylophilus sp.]|nr:sterol desaturase family protein [Methylophilus sp.]